MKEQWFSQLPIDSIDKVTPVSGGDVNQAYRVDTSGETYFLLVKPNQKKSFYESEIAGLVEMSKAGITVPDVIASGDIYGHAYLLLSYLEDGGRGSQAELGKMVAKLHQYHSPNGLYGFDSPYEGASMTFDNAWTDSWIELFVERRLDRLHEEIVASGQWSQADSGTFKAVREVIVDALKSHHSDPSLLHGDLWAGNYMFLADGQPALFDPASMYGDREFDLGATQVFGGFTEEFYTSYDEAYPLTDGASCRIEFYKLYLLMVHLHKFGGMYKASVGQSMRTILANA